MADATKKRTFIKIEDGRIKEYAFQYFFKAEGAFVTCKVPAFDLHFSSPNDEAEVKKRAGAMVRAFFNYWIKDVGPKQFFLELHKLNWRTENHNYALKKLLNKEKIDTKFQGPTELPDGFKKVESVSSQEEVPVF